jgi:hypothetical protein
MFRGFPLKLASGVEQVVEEMAWQSPRATRRAFDPAGILLTTPNAPRGCGLVQREIREVRDALAQFEAAVERGEPVGSRSDSLRAEIRTLDRWADYRALF